MDVMDPVDVDWLARALAHADVPVLLMVLVHLTGDRRWLAPRYQPERDGRLFAEESGGLPEAVQAEVRQAAMRTLTADQAFPHPLSDAVLIEMMNIFVGEYVAPEYLQPVLQDTGIRHTPAPPPLLRPTDDFHVTIIGAGISGICAAIRLRAMGIPFVVLEKNSSVGGTWYENVYPEAGVDTPNHFYSFSFASRWRWSSYFSKQHEILEYLEHCVETFGIRDSIVTGAYVEVASFDETLGRWRISYAVDGERRTIASAVLITAVGQVNEPKLPELEGLDRFAGRLFHTARWAADVELTGRRVALVGTGASAVQCARSIARDAARLLIFQRSPQWLMPNPDYHRTVAPEKAFLLERVPFYAAWYRFGLFWRYADGVYASLKVDPDWPHPERSVNATNDRHRAFLTRYMDAQLQGRPDLLAQTLPNYPPYGKRMVVDNDWFKTLRRPDVDLVSHEVTALTERGLCTADGTEHEVDVIVLATGFHATRMLWPLEILGRGGTSIHDAWQQDEPRTYLGMTTPGFPNLFMLLGPTTALAHGGSVVFQVEAQVHHLNRVLAEMINAGSAVVECTEDACERYTERADTMHANLVFSHPGMRNWYKNRRGRIVTVSPWRLVDYWTMTRELDESAYHFGPVTVGEAAGHG